MKTTLISLLLALLPGSFLLAQNFDYGNAWYQSRSGQPWVKLVVERDGIYRVAKADLIAAGHNLGSVQGQFLHLYYRGQEVPLFVGTTGGSWEYFDFYGRRNDGRIDSIMYRDPVEQVHSPDEQPNKAISIFTDESAYFLTWNNIPSAFRFFSEFDPTYTLFTPVSSFRYKAYREYMPGELETRYVQGGGDAFNSFFTLNSDYVTGEGYQGPGFGLGSPTTVKLATPFAFNDGLPLEVETRIFGRSLTEHIIQVAMNGNVGNLVLDTAFNSADVFQKTFFREFYPGSNLSSQTDLLYQALRSPTDNNHVSYAAITYSRLPQSNGDSLLWIRNWDRSQKAYLRIDGMKGSDSVYVYDLANGFRSVGIMAGTNQARVIVQGFNNTRDLLLVTEKGILSPRIEQARLNRLFDPALGAEYVIITDRKLSASALAYAQYRDTATVTPVSSVKVVYTDEIMDEFGYGSTTPWAIKRFCKYALDKWTVKPKYILLWGKGRYRTREVDPNYPQVVTFGYPATDWEFVSNWSQDTIEIRPEAAIGRVNIYSDAEGLNYLQKVNEYEHGTWEAWMKKGVFLGGGGNEAEQNQISNAFRYMTDRFEGVPFGGETIYFQKTQSSIVIDPNEATYHDEISDGSQMIHFFGHSTANIQDVSIREPFEYNNFGRYPLMIAMGCYGGDFTVGNTPEGASFGERWVREKGRGSIGYLGNSSAGYLDPLQRYGRIFYDIAYGRMSDRPIGEVLQSTLTIYTDSLRGIFFTNHGRQMNLQGDPAIRLYRAPGPDLEITSASVFFTPENFSAQDDSFRISIIVTNFGTATNDSITTTIRHRLPDGSVFEHPSIRSVMVDFRDTLSIVLINPVGEALSGQNFFEIEVDAEEEVEEYNEQNNFASVSKIVPGNIPAILSPREFAIVPDNRVVLQASTVFMTSDREVGFIFEIDTTETFTSPAKVNSGVVLGSSFLAAWEIPFLLQDSAVYYWRVRLANVTPVVWTSASFRHIATRTGWAQSQLPQFRKNPLNNMVLNQLGQRWEFAKFASEYEFITREGPNTSFSFSINGGLIADLSLSGVYFDQVAIVVLDQYTLKPKLEFPLSGVIGSGRPPDQLYKVRDAILAANDGDYVIVGSQGNPRVPQWPEDLFQALKLIGVSDNIRQLQDGKAFIVMGRKGYTSGATEVYSPTAENKFSLNTILYAPYDQGIITSTTIGPSIEWQNLWWDWSSLDAEPAENMTVSLFAIDKQENDSLIFTGVPDGTLNLDSLNALVYPYLRMEAKGRDTARRTAPQLDHWHVLYQPAPDLAVDAVTTFEFEADTLVEGESVRIRVGARNISELDLTDSVLVYLHVDRQDRARITIDSLWVPPLDGGGYAPIDFNRSTLNLGLDGFVTMVVELNPGRTPVEQHYFNNLFSQSVYVLVDRENPLLDVTFDGKHIINGDLVSPEPEILIEVNDENPFLALDDTTAFEIYLRVGLSQLNEVRIFVGDPRIEWLPATQPENKARIRFYPGRLEPLQDGVYGLRVQGKDKRGNTSGKGANLYEINFEVVSKSTVTRVLNYPNPFSTSTRFVYTLTGSEMPEVFQIHIYTLSGKMVKRIDLLELGDVHLGHNITNYSWDGTDEYGDRLANGVYLYKVHLRLPNEEIELRDTGMEQYFRNGWGKMYLMR